MKYFWRSFSFVFIFLILFSSFSNFALAQTKNPFSSVETNPDVKKNLHTFTQVVMTEVLSSATCLLGGVDPTTKNNTCLGIDEKTGKFGYSKENKGANRMFASIISSLYQNIPVSTNQYFAYMGNKFGFGEKAYASNGFQKLSPLISIWAVLRNVAYFFIAIAFVLVGTAIMLRVKIDPRTVMTIENQLPKLLVGLVLITFSFAIAGVLVDLMYVLVGLLFNIYVSIPGIDTKNLTQDFLQNTQPWDAVRLLIPTKTIPVDTSTIFNINLPTLPVANLGDTLIPQSFRDIVFFGGIFDVLSAGLNALSRTIFNLPIINSIPVQHGFGEGIADLAASAALSFGDVLKVFLKISPTSPQTGQSVPILTGLLGPLDPALIMVNFQKGSPTGAIIDIASAAIATSLGWKVGQAFGNTPLGPLIGIPAFGVFYGVIFNTIDTILRTWALNVLIWFVIYIAIFLAMTRLLFSLVVAWSTVLFQVVIAPLSIVFGLIPGAKMGFTPWLKSIAANLLAFPVTIGILLLGSALIQAIDTSGASGQIFIPPLVGGGQLNVALLMSLSVIFAASNGPQIAKDMLEEKENKNLNAFGTTSGTALQGVYKAGKATAYGFGKTPTPGQRGGFFGGFGQL